MVDYLTLTKKLSGLAPEVVVRSLSLPIGNFIPARPRYGYVFGFRFEDIYFYYGGAYCGDTILFVMSGKGCRQYEKRVGDLDIFVNNLDGWKITRIDRCYDVEYNIIEKVMLHLHDNLYTSHIKSYNHICNCGIKGNMLGETLYLGSYKSDMFIRIYDKGAEQGNDPGVLYRVEVCQRGKSVKNNIKDFKNSVLNFIRFIDRCNSNNNRVPTSKFWSDIFGSESVKRCYRTIEKISSNDYIYRIKGYVTRKILQIGIKNFFNECITRSRLYTYYSECDSKFLPSDFCYQ